MIPLSALGTLAIALIGAAIALAAGAQLSWTGSGLRRLWPRYVARLDRDAAFLRLSARGDRIAVAHAAGLAALVFVALLLRSASLGLLVPVAAVIPLFVLARERGKRVIKLEAQLPFWLLSVSNALKGSASLGEALAQSARLVPAPMSQELDQCLKEITLGAPIDQALAQMRDRVDSRLMATAIATLLVARRTGGDLPQILEATAAGLRELDRLEGVVRTKTAEGKAQAYLMGAMPFALCAAMNSIDETWLGQLTGSLIGNAIVFVAALLWIGAIVTTRKILAVDL